MFVEVQQNVDCTYRLYDYGRPRELHLDAGLAVARPEPHSDPRDAKVGETDNRVLVGGPHFYLLHLSGLGANALLPQDTNRFSYVRSVERRVGKEWVSTCRSRWA